MNNEIKVNEYDLEYKVRVTICCIFGAVIIGCFVAMVVAAFHGNLNYGVGFLILTWGSVYIARLLPIPKTVSERQRERERGALFNRLGKIGSQY